MQATPVLCLRIARHEGRIHLILMIVIVCQRGMDLRRCQVWILLDDLCGTIAMSHAIRTTMSIIR